MMEQPSPTLFLSNDVDNCYTGFCTYHSPDLGFEFYSNYHKDNNDSKDSLISTTKLIKKLHKTKRSYQNIPNVLRLELIDAVMSKGEKINHLKAAKRLGINYSSAKSICQIYKREGRSDKMFLKRKNVSITPDKPTEGGTKTRTKTLIPHDSLIITRETNFNINQLTTKSYKNPEPITERFAEDFTSIPPERSLVQNKKDDTSSQSGFRLQQRDVHSSCFETKPYFENISSYLADNLSSKQDMMQEKDPRIAPNSSSFLFSKLKNFTGQNSGQIVFLEEAQNEFNQAANQIFLQQQKSYPFQQDCLKNKSSEADQFNFSSSNQVFPHYRNLQCPMHHLVQAGDNREEFQFMSPTFYMIPHPPVYFNYFYQNQAVDQKFAPNQVELAGLPFQRGPDF